MARKTYTPQKLADGSHKIEGVEVFQLGEHRDFPFDADWFERCQKSHQRFDQTGFAPNVIIGHGKWDGEEPVFGDFGNVRLAEDGITVLVDYTLSPGIDPTIFNSYPHRSVRVNAERAYFAHVAQLGSSEPHFKLPSMHIPAEFSTDPDEAYQIIEFAAAEQDEFVSGSAPDDSSFINHHSSLAPPDDLTALRAQFEADLADFRAKLSTAEAEQNNLRAELEKFRQQQRAAEFADCDSRKQKLIAAGLCVPIVDKLTEFRKSLINAETPLEFTSGQATVNVLDFVNQFESAVLARLAENTLVAKTQPAALPYNTQPELPEFPADSGDAEFAAEQARDRKVKEYLRDKGQGQPASADPVHGWTIQDYRAAEAELTTQGLL